MEPGGGHHPVFHPTQAGGWAINKMTRTRPEPRCYRRIGNSGTL